MQTMNAPASVNSVPPAVYRVSTEDDVAVALRDLAAQETIAIGDRSVLVTAAIPRGHKLAIRPVSAGQVVRKYGWPIGRATADIAVGSHVHSHNLETLLSGADAYEFGGSSAATAGKPAGKGGSFLGYRRANGKVGTRNEIWILCTVGCVGRTAERIARLAAQKYAGRVDNVVAFPHQFGCSQLGGDLDRTRRLIAGLARHPNAGGVLILGLGCESNQLSKLLSEIPESEKARIRYFAAQATEDETEAGLQAVEELVQLAEKDQRVACGLDDLVVGLKCGGSDGFSGITANPLVGRIADRVTEAGGTAVLTEIPEIFGAEQLLMERAASREVFDGIVTIVNDFKEYFLRNNQPVHENPSPGNKAGGITTLEEKSLGAVQKGGHATVTQVLRYGERTTKPGLTLLEAPGNDGVSSTALVAAGATILLFTTGRGTPLGFPVPTLKISSNSVLAQHKSHWIDFDAGKALTAADPEAVTDEFLQLIVATASGQPARNELNEQREIAIWKDGVTL
ncbi:UxaA family hydrolase [Peristeroidobacter agariperforans]|uniref:UxaA family hydrolase n=1 Tax=Peristeroidobacter agariperforans TaxID=268404 RepID=UPI0018E55525|nr:altronate dehydratase family protein [Peristeroidobacter agariperforans]